MGIYSGLQTFSLCTNHPIYVSKNVFNDFEQIIIAPPIHQRMQPTKEVAKVIKN